MPTDFLVEIMKKLFYTLFLSFFSFKTYSQNATLQVSISRDTVLLGNAFWVMYTFDSKDGQFLMPVLEDGDILSQSFSSNTSIMDGEIKALHRQKFLIQPSGIGTFTIPSTVIKTTGQNGDIEVPKVQIFVKPNPQNLEIDPENDHDWQTVNILAGQSIKRKSKSPHQTSHRN